MASVSIVFRKDKLNKNDVAPIHFRIIKHRKISYISSGIMLPADHWDLKRNKVNSKHSNSARLNSFLANKFAQLQDQVYEYETAAKSLTSRQLKAKVFGKSPTSFFTFAQTVIEIYKREGRIGTYDRSCSTIAKLKAYPLSGNLCFQDITPGFLAKYDQYLRKVHYNSTNTVHKDLKFIRKLFNDAIREDIIERDLYPFNKYKLKTEKTQREHLTEEELKAIENLNIEANTRMDLHRNMFVFATYVGGLRISDILQLQWKNFDGSHINLSIKKTGVQHSVKVPQVGLNILDKYKLQKSNKNAHIFPMLPNNLNFNSPVEVDLAISSATAYINKNLKLIATKAGIEKKCSFHISRHSFAVRALQKGISIDKVSKLMAHASIRETQVYAKLVNKDLDKAMDAFN
jgi:integrase/recombinase XerD